MRTGKDTAFTVELLGLFILLIMVITIISSVFVMSRAHSIQARQLTEAVILAENTAEASSAAPDNDALENVITKLDNCIGHSCTSIETGESKGASVIYAASIKRDNKDTDDIFLIRVIREYNYGTPEERSDGGTYASDTIEVYDAGEKVPETGSIDSSVLKDPLYTLTAGTYFSSEDVAKKGGRS